MLRGGMWAAIMEARGRLAEVAGAGAVGRMPEEGSGVYRLETLVAAQQEHHRWVSAGHVRGGRRAACVGQQSCVWEVTGGLAWSVPAAGLRPATHGGLGAACAQHRAAGRCPATRTVRDDGLRFFPGACAMIGLKFKPRPRRGRLALLMARNVAAISTAADQMAGQLRRAEAALRLQVSSCDALPLARRRAPTQANSVSARGGVRTLLVPLACCAPYGPMRSHSRMRGVEESETVAEAPC